MQRKESIPGLYPQLFNNSHLSINRNPCPNLIYNELFNGLNGYLNIVQVHLFSISFGHGVHSYDFYKFL
jgi:hypothetical protein